MKTIGFFGDSFCASNQPESWCNILQQRLGCDRIRHFGEPGRSIWSVFFKFNELIRKNRVPDISIFCWTEPYRLYHPELVLSANTEPLEGWILLCIKHWTIFGNTYTLTTKTKWPMSMLCDTMIRTYCLRYNHRSYRRGVSTI
jgi:hypothetical protein